MTEDFYDLLGVTRDASQEEIRKAFRQQVRQYHPDLNDDPRAPAQFTALKKAYDTLGDPKERDDYDRMGHDDYVSKRINGLPSPDEWEIPEKANGTGAPSGDGDDDGGVTADDAAERSGSRSPDSENGTGGSASGSTGGTAKTSSATGARNASSSGGNRDARASRGPSATAAGSSGNGPASGRTTRRNDDATGGIQERLRKLQRISLGWPLIVLSDALYLAGLALYLAEYDAGVSDLADRLAAAATGPGSVLAVLGSESGIPPLPDYIVADIARGESVGGPLLILGMAFIPSVYFFIVRETRTIRTPWQPSYFYVLGALSPILGLILNVTADTPGVYVELACYVVLPVLAILGLPFSAFLRPRIQRYVRRTVRKLRD